MPPAGDPGDLQGGWRARAPHGTRRQAVEKELLGKLQLKLFGRLKQALEGDDVLLADAPPRDPDPAPGATKRDKDPLAQYIALRLPDQDIASDLARIHGATQNAC